MPPWRYGGGYPAVSACHTRCDERSVRTTETLRRAVSVCLLLLTARAGRYSSNGIVERFGSCR